MADDSAFKIVLYTGDDSVDRPITYEGDFVPDGVWISGTAQGSNTTYLKTTSHTGTEASNMRTGAIVTDTIPALLSNGFTVSHGAQSTNVVDEEYIAVVFRHTAGVVASGIAMPGAVVSLGWEMKMIYFISGGFFSTVPGFDGVTDLSKHLRFTDGQSAVGTLTAATATSFTLRGDAAPASGLFYIAWGSDGVLSEWQEFTGTGAALVLSVSVRPKIAIVLDMGFLDTKLPFWKTDDGMTAAESTAIRAIQVVPDEITALATVAPFSVTLGAGLETNTNLRIHNLLVLDSQDEPTEPPEPVPDPTVPADESFAERVAAGGGGIELLISQALRDLEAQSLHPAADCLAKMGTRLHDDGAIWTEAELLDWYNDGYRELLGLSGAIRRFRAIRLPPRRAMAITQDWEDRHAGGPVGKVTHATAGGYYQTLGQWEIEQSVA